MIDLGHGDLMPALSCRCSLARIGYLHGTNETLQRSCHLIRVRLRGDPIDNSLNKLNDMSRMIPQGNSSVGWTFALRDGLPP